MEQKSAQDSRKRIHYGLLVDDNPVKITRNGRATQGGYVAVGFHDEKDPSTAAHELGHNFGRRHTDCWYSLSNDNEPDPDADYPNPNGYISPDVYGDTAQYGFNTFSEKIYPAFTCDLMSYGTSTWISGWTYTQIKQVIEERFGAASDLSASRAPLAFDIRFYARIDFDDE